MTKIYDYSAFDIDGNEICFSEFKGKVLLIVNTASKCGFTKQYAELELLHEKYKNDGLVVIGFPCNQFANQEPGNEAEIKSFCNLNYNVTFKMFSKIIVNGDNEHPIYRYLKSHQKGVLGIEAIKWNFTKFLINKYGDVVARYAPITSPLKLENKIKQLLME